MRISKRAFSLIEVSIVLVVVSIVLAGLLPYLTERTKISDINSTTERLEAIQEALLLYSIQEGRLPCPADATIALTDSNFGVQADNQGNCTGGGIEANFSDALSEIVGGAVPTKTLNLPDDFAFDGWGRRFTYHVTTPVTSALASGAIRVNDASGNERTSNAIYVLISHGTSGHGAYTIGGTRFNGGVSQPNELENCDCDSSGNDTAYNATFVQSFTVPGPDPSQRFDDIVRWALEEHLLAEGEQDPQVGAITDGQWCRGSSGTIVCDQVPPGSGPLDCTTESISNAGLSSTASCPADRTMTGGGGSCAGSIAESRPQGNGWYVLCNATPSSAYVRCCRTP